jgi:HTH-type transcriptional regulator, competence development regulator
MKQTFGEYIRQLRTDRGLTLTQLAAQLDMDSANLSKVENGKREFDYKRIERLAIACNLALKNLKEEFLSDQFAKTIYETNSDTSVLKLAEEKVKYRKQKSTEQGILKF